MPPQAAVRPSLTDRVPAWTLAVTAMLSVQLGAALSVWLFPAVGTSGTAWLRLTAGALIFLVVVHPRPRDIPRSAVPALLALGVATATMTVAFLAAIDRIPLGTAVAIEFLGPLTVATVRARERRLLVWPALAFVGVLVLTRPWQAGVDLIGVACALLAATGWGAYIVLTQHVGDRVAGLTALSVTIPVAALVSAPLGAPQAIGGLTWVVLLAAVGIALLLPVVPLSLEMHALRRLTATAFGTLMALEPAIAMVIGAVLLHQVPTLVQCAGIGLVVAAGIGAERRGRRGAAAGSAGGAAAGSAGGGAAVPPPFG